MTTAILIPARYASTRFPGKPLCDLDGIPMIKRVYKACAESGIPTYILTDDVRIASVFKNASVIIDYKGYANGTERCAGAIDIDYMKKYDQFINVQGDMPDVSQHMIEKTLWHLKHYPITTMWTDLQPGERLDINQVKVIIAGDKALWFGRGFTYGHHHLGIYGYRRNVLEMYSSLPVTREERNEGLEQLRWLKAGYDIGILKTVFNGIEINTPEDLEKWNDSRKSMGQH
jgi:3-deoxy-manno-octulosonate cytidylyltransferase (CMP-KDO synthetase)